MKSGKTKAKKQEITRREPEFGQIIFSGGMARIMATTLKIRPEQRDGFVSAYELLPLNQVKECIDVAYRLSLDGADGIPDWIERYQRLAKRALPKWARKNSRQYIIQTYAALDSGDSSRINEILFEFKGFIYAVFCRALIACYLEVKDGKSTADRL